MKNIENDFCQDCGELNRDCLCVECQEIDDTNLSFKFEYAFESLTDSKSFFKTNLPIQ